jgi:uncharacterized protein YkwD
MNHHVSRAFLCAALSFLIAGALPRMAGAQNTAALHHVYVPLAQASTPAPGPEQQVLALINQARHDNGCNVDLVMSDKLTDAAYGHSRDMALNNYFSHTGSDGSTMVTRVQAQGYSFSWLAENIAAGYSTPKDAVDGWMNSSGHRANILNCNLRETGIGYYYQGDDQPNVHLDGGSMGGPYGYYWTQDFGTP